MNLVILSTALYVIVKVSAPVTINPPWAPINDIDLGSLTHCSLVRKGLTKAYGSVHTSETTLVFFTGWQKTLLL